MKKFKPKRKIVKPRYIEGDEMLVPYGALGKPRKAKKRKHK